MALIASRALCCEIAAAAVGCELSQVDPSGDEDALKEAANLMCGHLTTTIGGPDPVWDLSPPVAEPCTAEAWHRTVEAPGAFCYRADDEWLVLQIECETARTPAFAGC